MKIYDCRTKGLIKLKENMWLTTEKCIIRNCIIPRNMIILASPAISNVKFEQHWIGFTEIRHDNVTDADIKNGLYLIDSTSNLFKPAYDNKSECLYLASDNQTTSMSNLPEVHVDINPNYISTKKKCINDITTNNDTVNINDLNTLMYYFQIPRFTDHRKYQNNGLMSQSFVIAHSDTDATDKYAHIKYVNDLYSVTYNDNTYELKYLTMDNIEQLTGKSKYELEWLYDDKYNINDRTINTLKAYGIAMYAFHEAYYKMLNHSIEDEIMSMLKEAKIQCDKEDIKNILHTINFNLGVILNPFKTYTHELNTQDERLVSYNVNVYFDNCKSIFGLDAKAFNIELDNDFCNQTRLITEEDIYSCSINGKYGYGLIRAFLIKDIKITDFDNKFDFGDAKQDTAFYDDIGLAYIGDAMLTNGEMLKDAVIEFDNYYAGNLGMHLYSLAQIAKAYKASNGKLDIQNFCYKHNIPGGCVGKYVKDFNTYQEYKSQNKIQNMSSFYTEYDKDDNITLIDNKDIKF